MLEFTNKKDKAGNLPIKDLSDCDADLRDWTFDNWKIRDKSKYLPRLNEIDGSFNDMSNEESYNFNDLMKYQIRYKYEYKWDISGGRMQKRHSTNEKQKDKTDEIIPPLTKDLPKRKTHKIFINLQILQLNSQIGGRPPRIDVFPLSFFLLYGER